MSSDSDCRYLVAVVGAGPAGIYSARQLAADGARVALLNRDIKPGGLAEYGIYPNKYKMKGGLRKQFEKILSEPNIDYYGNLNIGRSGDLTLEDLFAVGFQAILVTVGAQGTKWLGLPGEEHRGVYHAKDLVYYYNGLPPFSEMEVHFGRRAALIGVGNVMCDIGNWAVRDLKIDEAIAVARRGPAEVKYTRKEFEIFSKNLDVEAFEAEFSRCLPMMQVVGQDADKAKEFILSAVEKGQAPNSETRFHFDFLASPTAILADEKGAVSGLEIEDTTLVKSNGATKAKRLGTTRILDVDTVVFCIGDTVDADFGLPMEWNEFAKNPEPRFPIDDVSYEAFDPETSTPLPGIFLAGWARAASEGLVGAARKDGTNGAKAVAQHLAKLEPAVPLDLEPFRKRLASLGRPVVTHEDLQRLGEIELLEAHKQELVEFKYHTNTEMLRAIGAKESV